MPVSVALTHMLHLGAQRSVEGLKNWPKNHSTNRVRLYLNQNETSKSILVQSEPNLTHFNPFGTAVVACVDERKLYTRVAEMPVFVRARNDVAIYFTVLRNTWLVLLKRWRSSERKSVFRLSTEPSLSKNEEKVP